MIPFERDMLYADGPTATHGLQPACAGIGEAIWEVTGKIPGDEFQIFEIKRVAEPYPICASARYFIGAPSIRADAAMS